jgi:DNA-binding CsgD family transcriptional regulator
MVGRESELRELLRLATSGRPGTAMIAGEPGIGKTRLVRELVAAVPAGTVVLVGHAEPGSLSRPYEVLLDAVGDRPGHEAALAELTDASRSLVERLHAGLALLTGIIGDAPAVVVFEDLHWADSESAALFERLAEQPGPRLLIGTYRPDEVTRGQPVAHLLDRLERRHGPAHLRLDRLSMASTGALVTAVTGQPAPYRTVAALHHRTGGNPFFLEELLRGRAAEDVDKLADLPLPWTLAELLRGQVDQLADEPRRVVETAAVLGYRVPFDLLAAVTGTPEGALIATLRELVEGAVLVEEGEDEFSFRHALVRETVTAAMLGRQRRRLHEAALEVLLAGGEPDPAMVAHHAHAAGRYDDMIAAARRGTALYLSIGSAYQALQLAEMGLNELPEDVDLLAGAARAAWLAGMLDDAVRYGRRWRDAAGTDPGRAEALELLVRVGWDANELDELRRATAGLEELIERAPHSPHAAQAMTAVAYSRMLQVDVDATQRWADRAVALAGELDLPAVRLAALLEKGAALIDRASRADEGWAILAGLVDEAERLGEWVTAARALHLLVTDGPAVATGRHAELLERMRVDAERAGFEKVSVAAYYQGRARVALREGDLATAIDALEAGRRRDRGYRRIGRRADYHAVFVAGLYLEALRLDDAGQVVDDLRALPQPNPVTLPTLAFHLACRRGEVATAEAALDEVFSAIAPQPWRDGGQAYDLIAGALAAGLPLDRVDEMVRELLDPDAWDEPRALVDALVAEARGEHAQALASYLRVAGSPALLPAAAGSAHLGAARCLLATDRADEATGHATTAAGLLARWSGWRVAELDAVRARLGLTSDVDAVTGPAALTPRELEVALLIADGLTNAELGRRLHISPKTAAVHVSSILRKLGAASRTEVPDLLTDQRRPVGR